jgi:hypothetical protein
MTDAKRAATEVVLGVDTHLDVHVVVALDHLGRRLGELTVPTTAKGYESLVCWAEGFGTVRCAGVEGTSSYGAGIARHLKTAAIPVTEVERPRRRHLHRNSKSDSRDAERAARAVLAGETAGEPKSADGRVEMIRALRTARRSAVKSRTQAANQLRCLRVTAPDGLRHRLRGLSTKELVAVRPPASVSKTTLTTYWRRPGSHFVRWPVATRSSPKRSPSWTCSSIGWWWKPPRS